MDKNVLKVELENELFNKKQCSYEPYECSQLCLDGFKYCHKHILRDASSPFTPCSYFFTSNGKRCNLPAPRGHRKNLGYCHEHALKTSLVRSRHHSNKHTLPQTPEVLLNSITHYVKKPKCITVISDQYDCRDKALDTEQIKSARFVDPIYINSVAISHEKRCNILDACSGPESDIEASTFCSVWQDAHVNSSENESVDSENEDPLKHVNVYTEEEILVMAKDRAVKLQSFYIEEYRNLQHLLTEKRRKYLHSLKREKETCCNIHSQIGDTPKKKRLYQKLKALNNYQKHHGVDAILYKKSKEKQITYGPSTSSQYQNENQKYSKCIFTEGGVRCEERNLPLALYCLKHILEDPNQVLFQACGKMTDDVKCQTPIAAIFNESCSLHLDIPDLKSYGQLRKESTGEETNHAQYELPEEIPEWIKDELMNCENLPDVPKMESVPKMLFEESPKETCVSPDTNTFLFGVGYADLLDDDKKRELEDKQAEECAKTLMELSAIFANGTQQLHGEEETDKEEERKDDEHTEYNKMNKEKLVSSRERLDKREEIHLNNSIEVDYGQECDTDDFPISDCSIFSEDIDVTSLSSPIRFVKWEDQNLEEYEESDLI